MAGMEQLEIHSKVLASAQDHAQDADPSLQSYLVRWVSVEGGHTISWSVRPDKRSINFGIFKHPGSEHAPTPKLPSSTFEPPPTPALRPDAMPVEGLSARSASSTAAEKLKSTGLKPISWYGTCEANRVSTGKYDVPPNEGGMYALVFDNTFAKQFSKTATFVLLTYPTQSPPQSNHHIHRIQGAGSESATSLKETLNQKKKLGHQSSSESVPQLTTSTLDENRASDHSQNKRQAESESNLGSKFFTGVLQKRRRKKHQGWARRFFSLDYATSTLSYYHNRNTLSLRGAVPLSLAAIGANATTRQISIDSGAEIWHLKASSRKDFEAWKHALERARARAPVDLKSPVAAFRKDSLNRRMSGTCVHPEEDREWARVEALVGRLNGTRDAARSLAKDTDPKYLPLPALKPPLERAESKPLSGTSNNSESPSDQSLNGYFYDGGNERRPFWKRKPSAEKPMLGIFIPSASATPSLLSRSGPPTPLHTSSVPETRQLLSHSKESIHGRCMSLLRDLDAIVADFNLLVQESKQPRTPLMSAAISRHSTDSQDDEFFDAEGFSHSQLLAIHDETDEEASERGCVSDGDSSFESEVDERASVIKLQGGSAKTDPAFPPRPSSLTPLPTQPVKRRTAVHPPTVNPPSLIGFLRKNVGKDLSTISMPVSANEPISLLQRLAEVLEYSSLLDTAGSAETSTERLLYITTFAISSLSSARVKERAIRKPFNPMLGESFDLVREDRGFRFLAEKVSHRPVRMACQADSERWSLTQAPLPTQKFWGKSAELMTEGKIRILMHPTGDRFSWTPATTFLRNIIAGEKYVEPVGTMIVTNETTGENAVVTFKSGGMFSGRSEDVVVEIFDGYGGQTSLGLIGKWTSSLAVTENSIVRQSSNPIWTVGDLPAAAPACYGFTSFASTLNEITSQEKDKLPPTDSRLRPDQRAAEDGDIDQAELLKAKLEEAQRQRRKIMEERGIEWRPKWFEKVETNDGEEAWVEKLGKDGYWDRRQGGRWDGVERIFDV
ncbi:MAG: hypothetical protein Q9217_001607 [Psora testacea]